MNFFRRIKTLKGGSKMEQLRDIVRSKVDQMRAEGYAQSHDRQALIESLSRSMPALGSDIDSDSRTQVLHMCPWHTCQATRHN